MCLFNKKKSLLQISDLVCVNLTFLTYLWFLNITWMVLSHVINVWRSKKSIGKMGKCWEKKSKVDNESRSIIIIHKILIHNHWIYFPSHQQLNIDLNQDNKTFSLKSNYVKFNELLFITKLSKMLKMFEIKIPFLLISVEFSFDTLLK
jgi:hypothetical protein